MVECAQRPRDVFLATCERSIDRTVLRKVIGGLPRGARNRTMRFNEDDATTVSEPWEPDYESAPIPGTRRNATNQSFWNRVKMATIGGIFLLGPMWLMVLAKTWRYTGLVTTTACVFLFGLYMSFAVEKPMDVLTSTAAYAAVLVVFVGVNTD